MQRFLAEEQERERVRKAFESYVAPTVVQEMLKHPEQLRLGGERRQITLLFTDIRGFTTISENLENDPQSLVRMLHDFLNPMSNIIINHGGTIDKYMGDAIMALFGAPLIQPDHARLACRAALDMTIALKNLNAHWQTMGRPLIRIGVGVNSGPVTVGNLGSDRLFDYTAVGDNVNLASRLEGLNKYYGTSILISQTTAELIGDGFILREVDRVRVKGKAQAAGIFEVIGEGEAAPKLTRFLDSFHQGLALYRERRWQESLAAFTAALEDHPEDGATLRYQKLVQQLIVGSPRPRVGRGDGDGREISFEFQVSSFVESLGYRAQQAVPLPGGREMWEQPITKKTRNSKFGTIPPMIRPRKFIPEPQRRLANRRASYLIIRSGRSAAGWKKNPLGAKYEKADHPLDVGHLVGRRRPRSPAGGLPGPGLSHLRPCSLSPPPGSGPTPRGSITTATGS